MKQKIIYFILIIFLLIFLNNGYVVNAAINESYGNSELDVDYSDMSSGSVLLNWIGEILYNFAEAAESILSGIVKVITGRPEFPWIDKVIFNTIPILDVNFINPASGSLFEDSNGQITNIGNLVRNIYFTVLSMSLGFIGIVIALIAIKLAVSSIASEKAKYKQAVVNWLLCLILLFGLHFLISFVFYLNEKMVELASNFMTDILNDTTGQIVQEISEASDSTNAQTVENFINQANKKCFLEEIPIIGPIYNVLTDVLHAVGRVLEAIGKAVWSFITGEKSDDDVISQEQLGTLYPKKDDYINYFKDENHPERVDVAGYLLKNYFYRNTYLQWVSGTDTNKFSNGGLGGVGRNILVTVNDIVGVADPGYKALRSLFTSTVMVCYNPEGDSTLYNTTLQDTYEKAKSDAGDKFDEKDFDDNNLSQEERNKNKVDESLYYASYIKSTEDYISYIDNLDESIDRESSKSSSERDETLIVSLKLDKLYAQAYYKYIYDGDDKITPDADNFISELGTYFKNASWYTDLDAGEWAPTSINVVAAIAYGIFIIQSLLIFIAYIKRFFFVVILSMFGPVIVVFDFIIKSI